MLPVILVFINTAQSAPYQIIPDYTIPFLGGTPISTIAAGVIGVIVVLAIVFIAGRSLQSQSPIPIPNSKRKSAMHSDAFDRYHHENSALHHLDPRIKVVVTIAFILSNALLPDGAWLAFALAWLFLILANALSELGSGLYIPTFVYCFAVCAGSRDRFVFRSW